MSLLSRALEPNNLRLLFGAGGFASDVVHELREDAHFAHVLRRGLLPSPRDPGPVVPHEIFPPLRPIDASALRGKRVGIVASGGSGALASLVGVQRALEAADLEVTAISACSGAVLFAALWALGHSADEIGRFWLSLRSRDYIDPDWRSLARAGMRGFRDFGGFMRGEALERTFREHFGDRSLGDAKIPFFFPAWNIDRNRLLHLGSIPTPDLPLATAVRIAISIPLFVEPVRVGEHLYGDGGVVTIFPSRPLLDIDPPLDVVLGINCYFPENFDGIDIGDWRPRSFAIFRASAQLRTCVSLELAREEVRLFGRRLTMIHPVPYTEIAGAKFYESFLDRSRWSDFMRMGRDSTRAFVESFPMSGKRPSESSSSIDCIADSTSR